MSRSYKKHPWVKCAGDPSMKKLFNRRIRRSNKALYTDMPNGNAYKKTNCSWDIADYRCYCSWEEFREWNWVREKYFDSEEEARAHWKKHYGSK